MTRYWIEFDEIAVPYAILTYGVSAYNYEDALYLIRKKALKNKDLPEVKKVIENIDVSTLDADHVLINMYPPNWRGIWFPLGFND